MAAIIGCGKSEPRRMLSIGSTDRMALQFEKDFNRIDAPDQEEILKGVEQAFRKTTKGDPNPTYTPAPPPPPVQVTTSLKDCVPGSMCHVDLPGTKCADGSVMRITAKRPSFMDSLDLELGAGGACWDTISCNAWMRSGIVNTVNFSSGLPYANNSEGNNPLASPENTLRIGVPYCTADLFAGTKKVDYTQVLHPNIYLVCLINQLSESDGPSCAELQKPVSMYHYGAKNLDVVLNEIKSILPNPNRIRFAGYSAGGLGVLVNAHKLAAVFPLAKRYVYSDAGLPFTVEDTSALIPQIVARWGAIHPAGMSTVAPNGDAEDYVRYNAKFLPNDRIAFITTKKDYVMTAFSLALGAPLYTYNTVVQKIIDRVSPLFRKAPLHNIFVMNGDRHGLDISNPIDPAVRTWAIGWNNNALNWLDVFQ